MAAVPAVLTAAVVLSYSTVLLQVPPAVIPVAAVLAGRLADSAAGPSVEEDRQVVGDDLRVFSVYIPFLIIDRRLFELYRSASWTVYP